MKKKIMIVEDHYANRYLIEEVLDEYEVYGVPNGTRMRELLKTVIPDLILMDVNLPEEDGYELTKELKQTRQTKDIPIIFLTIHNTKPDVMHAIDAGGVDFIVKPFDEQDIKERIKKALDAALKLKLKEKDK